MAVKHDPQCRCGLIIMTNSSGRMVEVLVTPGIVLLDVMYLPLLPVFHGNDLELLYLF